MIDNQKVIVAVVEKTNENARLEKKTRDRCAKITTFDIQHTHTHNWYAHDVNIYRNLVNEQTVMSPWQGRC